MGTFLVTVRRICRTEDEGVFCVVAADRQHAIERAMEADDGEGRWEEIHRETTAFGDHPTVAEVDNGIANLLSKCRTAITEQWDEHHIDTTNLVKQLDCLLTPFAELEKVCHNCGGTTWDVDRQSGEDICRRCGQS